MLIICSKSLLLLILLNVVGCYSNVISQRTAIVLQSLPKSIEIGGWQEKNHYQILSNHGFTVGYSNFRGNPIWVNYFLHSLSAETPFLKRLHDFKTDLRVTNQVTYASYTGSGYDRGHMAPNAAMSKLYGTQAQADSFLMTNIVPQKANLNRQWWYHLESMELYDFTRQFQQIMVITGPVFDTHSEYLKSNHAIEIPDAFYKIYMAQSESGKWEALAFLVPQTAQGKDSLHQYVTRIDDIENVTGLDFFSELDDNFENSLEAAMDYESWHLQDVRSVDYH